MTILHLEKDNRSTLNHALSKTIWELPLELTAKFHGPMDSAERERGEIFTGPVGGQPPAVRHGHTGNAGAAPQYTQRTTAISFLHRAPNHHKIPRPDRVTWKFFARSGERRRCVMGGRRRPAGRASPYRKTTTRVPLTGQLGCIR